jgi:hypothetical protein
VTIFGFLLVSAVEKVDIDRPHHFSSFLAELSCYRFSHQRKGEEEEEKRGETQKVLFFPPFISTEEKE